MISPLADRGIASVAIALSSCGEIGDELGDLYADVDSCRRAIAEVDGPVILGGHSYGGVVITEAGGDDRVTKLLYVTSVMPAAGQSQADLIGSEPAPWLMPGDDGTIGVRPELIREFFLQDCDEGTTKQALARLTRQSLTSSRSHPARSPGSRNPRRTSSAQKISLLPLRYSVSASRRAHDFSSSEPDTTRSSRAPKRSRRASPPRSTASPQQTARAEELCSRSESVQTHTAHSTSR